MHFTVSSGRLKLHASLSSFTTEYSFLGYHFRGLGKVQPRIENATPLYTAFIPVGIISLFTIGYDGYCHSASRALDVRKTRRIMTEPQLS